MVSDIKKKLKLIGIILAVIALFALLIYFHIFWWTMLGLLVLIIVLLHFSVSIHLEASRSAGISIKAKWLFLTLYPRGSGKKKPAQNAPPAEPLDAFDDDLLADLDEFADSAEDSPDEAPEPESASETAEGSETSEESSPEEEKDEPSESEAPPEESKDKKKKEKAEKPPKEKGKGKLAALKEKFEKVRPYIPIGWKAVKKFCKAIRFEGVEIQGEVGRFDAHEAAIYYGMVQKLVFGLLEKIALIFTLKLKRADVRCCFNENRIDGSAALTVRVRPSTLIAIAFCTGINFLITFLRQRRKKKKAAKAQAAAA